MRKIALSLAIIMVTALIMLNSSRMVAADTEDANDVGVEWTNSYGFWYDDPDEGSIYLSNLQYNDDLVTGFYNKLGADGFSKKFNWGDSSAWEEDFKKVSLGGTDSSWADDVDFVVYSGHGWPTGFYFNNDHDDKKLRGTEDWHDAEWGDKDLEWIMIDACQVLIESDDHGNWAKRWGWGVFKGLHLILGWDSIADDDPNRGSVFAEYMIDYNYRICDAWFKACDETAPSGSKVAFICVAKTGYHTYYDHLWGHGEVKPDCPNPNVLGYTPHTVP